MPRPRNSHLICSRVVAVSVQLWLWSCQSYYPTLHAASLKRALVRAPVWVSTVCTTNTRGSTVASGCVTLFSKVRAVSAVVGRKKHTISATPTLSCIAPSIITTCLDMSVSVKRHGTSAAITTPAAVWIVQVSVNKLRKLMYHHCASKSLYHTAQDCRCARPDSHIISPNLCLDFRGQTVRGISCQQAHWGSV
jgi:hypothetical protein